MNEAPPLCCSKSGDDLLHIAQTFRTVVSDGLIERERTASGARFRVRHSAHTEAQIHEFVQRESECCPFFEFAVDRGHDEISLEIAGPVAAGSLLDLLYRLAEPPVPCSTCCIGWRSRRPRVRHDRNGDQVYRHQSPGGE
jgi:hypothetical protein